MTFKFLTVLSILLALSASLLNAGEDVYLEPDKFIEQSFTEEPNEKVIWLTKEVKEAIKEILDRDYNGLRIRYWQNGDRTAWILEEIGKVKPITAGFVVEANQLVEMRVLIYRESHGWEVRYPFFTDQFKGLKLEDGTKLSESIDGISGATLSVNALTRLARLSLFLHKKVTS